MLIQPRLSTGSWPTRRHPPERTPGSPRSASLAGVYGGYFGAAQGILLLAILGLRSPTTSSG